MKRFIAILLSLALCGTTLVTAVDVPTDETIRLQFSEVADIAKENNATVKVLRKQVASIKAFDFFSEEQSALHDASTALGSGQNQMNKLIDGIKNQTEVTNGLQESIQANTMSIRGVVGSMAAISMNGRSYAKVMQCYVDEAGDQAAYGAELLYITYDYLDALQTELTRRHSYLTFVLQKVQLSYDLGMISKVELLEQYLNEETLQNAIEDTKDLKKIVLGNLKILMGYPQDITIELSPIEKDDFEEMEDMVYSSDVEIARKKNHTLKAKSEEAVVARKEKKSDSISSKRLYEASKLELTEAKKQFEIDFRNVYDRLLQSERALSLESNKSAVENENLRVATVKYEVEFYVLLDLRSAQDKLDSQLFAEKEARTEYIKALITYRWAMKGLLNNSMNELQQES